MGFQLTNQITGNTAEQTELSTQIKHWTKVIRGNKQGIKDPDPMIYFYPMNTFFAFVILECSNTS